MRNLAITLLVALVSLVGFTSCESRDKEIQTLKNYMEREELERQILEDEGPESDFLEGRDGVMVHTTDEIYDMVVIEDQLHVGFEISGSKYSHTFVGYLFERYHYIRVDGKLKKEVVVKGIAFTVSIEDEETGFRDESEFEYLPGLDSPYSLIQSIDSYLNSGVVTRDYNYSNKYESYANTILEYVLVHM